jgi:hypothetical protein
MQGAAQATRRTLAILSQDYPSSAYTPSEWAAAFANDLTGMQHKLAPVRVRECQPAGLLAQIIAVGLDETVARNTLLNGIAERRVRPASAPIFPGRPAALATPALSFPGLAPAVVPATGATCSPQPRRESAPEFGFAHDTTS